MFLFACVTIVGLAGTLTVLGQLETLSVSERATEAFFSAQPRTVASPVNQSSVSIVGETETDETVFSSYTAPEGFIIKSFSSKWGESKLAGLYQELKQNATGNEISYLREILLYAQEQENILGAQEESYGDKTIALQESGLPGGLQFTVYTEMSTIRLYGADKKTTVDQMARTLSHEYGHLFTNHYFFKGLSNDQLLASPYASVRGLGGDSRVLTDMSDYDAYVANHAWYLREIAAEDYVQLMGSPLAKVTARCYDSMQRLKAQADGDGELPSNTVLAATAYNISPQENMALPLADEVGGLYGLFASCLGREEERTPAGNDITVSVAEKSETFRLTTGKTKFRYYKISFTAVEDAVLYTLLIYNRDGGLYYPVKTVAAGESRSAVVGNVPLESGGKVYSLNNELTGKKQLRVTALLSDGRITVSQPFSFDFGG